VKARYYPHYLGTYFVLVKDAPRERGRQYEWLPVFMSLKLDSVYVRKGRRRITLVATPRRKFSEYKLEGV
jgi:hypothetical protein